MTRTLAMTGATGFVGGATLRRAVEAGWHVRALTRRPQPEQAGVTWIAGSLEDMGSLARMAEGSDAVLHVAGVVNVSTRAAFDAGNRIATDHVMGAARGAGAARFVHVSSLAAREPGLSDYGWSKAGAERAVRASGLAWTIVRPPAVFGPGDTEMLDLFRMARRGIVTAPRGRLSVIHVDELARLLVALVADRDASIGAIYEPDDGRPDGWSHRDFARAIGRAMGRGRVATLTISPALLKAGGWLDPMLRRERAKLTPDRARYIAHPDWVVAKGACPPAELWRCGNVSTEQALADTARWYRERGWLR